MQLPIICSRIAGNIDIVTNGQTGLIFEPSNETEMQQQVEFAMNHQKEMKQMGENLEQIVTNNYKMENIWQNILSAYNSLLNLTG
jgi:glycosyltransferase involved in cell wall biosynthesis